LPTEAQWEYACRAGTTTAFNTGVTISTDQANYHGRYIYGKGKEGIIRGKTTPAGAFPPNQFGLFDMHGNARQWCSDTRGESWDSPSRPESVEKKPFFAARGGSWVNSPIASRAACRDAFLPDDRYDTLGFRIIVELDGPVAPSR
jgi:formylglycine-generating enzyme required for sulfatase activity